MKRMITLLCMFSVCFVLAGCSLLFDAAQPAPGGSSAVPTKAPAASATGLVETTAPTEEPEMTTVPEVTAEPEISKPVLLASGSLDVFSISQESFLRSGDAGLGGRLNELSSDEYYAAALHLTYNGEGSLSWSEAYVTVDGGEKWGWTAGELPSGSSTVFHIYHVNMQKLEEGTHTARWYLDGEELCTSTFTLQRDLDWSELCDLPTDEQIAAHNASASLRSPYISMWLDIPDSAHYTEYQIDFKSDHAPQGSYFAIANFMMDYSSLQQQYAKVYTEYGITGYAGFQNIYNGNKICILSVWDTYCQDASGNVTTIRAEQTYPANAYQSGEFGGEGVGAQCLVEYDWQENHWYRAHLRCYDGANGNTQLEYSVTDLSTGVETLLCAYDMGVPGLVFRGSNCIFLENYIIEHSGDIRTMEIRNAMYLDRESDSWHGIDSGRLYSDGGALQLGYAGSYDYGTDDGRLWIMTTGVGSDGESVSGKHIEFGK